MKRLWGMAAVLLVGVMLTLAGCGGNAASNADGAADAIASAEGGTNTAASAGGDKGDKEPVKLVFATNETPILTKEFWKTVSEKFMQENPGIVVENIASPSSNVFLRDYLKTLLATGQFPDVMVMSAPGDFVPSGALMELPDDFLSFAANPEMGRYNGKQYLVPYKKMLAGLFYNKKVFTNLGIAEPKTYDELLALSKKLKESNIIPFAMGLKDGWAHAEFASMILSADLLANDPNWGKARNEGAVKFSDANFKKAMEKYVTLTTGYSNADYNGVSYAQQLELFFTGKAAMLPMGSWALGEEQRLKPDFEVGFFPFPGDTGSDTVAVYVNEGLSISAKTEHPEEAKKFVQFFLTNKDWYGQFLKTEMLFPTTKEDVPYEMSQTRQNAAARIAGLKEVEVWGSMTGDASLLPGLQGYFSKMTANIVNGSDLGKELELFDKEWDKAHDNLNK